ncbi:plasminogen receptor (KT)-like [Amphiura filiformis]|uniref:plasminogen receptor (KT)-like n=1 Tax=Amphiura filiformis TaxID=82378 RepID=UPI003B227619
MGSMISKAMDESFQKQKNLMNEQQRTVMERQLVMQNQMREKQMAMSMSGSRELLNWYGSFYAIALLGMVAGFSRTKNPAILVPALPLTWIVGYQYDWAYGSKVHRIRDGAEAILKDEHDKLGMPLGMPTFIDIERVRLAPPEDELDK